MQPDGGAIAKHINNAFIPPMIGTIKRGSVVAPHAQGECDTQGPCTDQSPPSFA